MAQPIAIIGMAGRFPGADSPAALWEMLLAGRSGISPVPADRPPLQPLLNGQATRWGGFLSDVDQFDADFFGIAPREAAEIDPQHRLLMEIAWEALEDAGIPPRTLAGSSAGVFVGLSSNNWATMVMNDLQRISPYTNSGASNTMAANRLSYQLDLRGPSVVIDTACSSSLVAVHQACRSLESGDCGIALVGGSNLILTPGPTLGMEKLGTLPPDGISRVFDADGHGSPRGEGAGIIILKPLAQARGDGDHIYAIIRGTAVNHGGKGNGLLAPNRWAQEAVFRAACEHAGVAPSDIAYAEAHSTGTPIGDAAELAALGAVLASGRATDRPCRIGSIKGNLGHLEAAAGIAALIKATLSLHHRQFAPTLHFQTPNPHVPWDRLPLRVQTTAESWPATSHFIASVGATGYGGANAHVILEAADTPPTPESADDSRWQLLILSAANETALRALARRYATWIDEHPQVALAALCATAAGTRETLRQRLAIVGHSSAKVRAALLAFADQKSAPDIFTGRALRKPATGVTLIAPDGADRRDALRALARDFVAGHDLPWQALDCGPVHRELHLPHYPFQRTRHWADQCDIVAAPPGAATGPLPTNQPSCPQGKPSAAPSPQFIAPYTSTQRDLAPIWEQVLGIKPIGANSNFFDLGGHSVMALELFSAVEEQLGRTLPLASLFKAPTLAELADLFDQETPYQSEPMVTFNAQGARPTLYLLPGVGGHAFSYRALSIHLGADQPMCVLQAPGVDATRPPLETIEAIAAAFVQDILKHQPDGPYNLCGYSFGGQVAYEIARQLLDAGHAVGPVMLVDSQARGGMRKRPLPFWLAAHARRLIAATPADRGRYVRERWQNLNRRLFRTWLPEPPVQHKVSTLAGAINQVTEANGRAWHHYTAPPSPLEVILFRCAAVEDWRDFYELDATNGWGAIARGGVIVHEIEGPHELVLDEPYVGHVATLMRDVLDRGPSSQASDSKG